MPCEGNPAEMPPPTFFHVQTLTFVKQALPVDLSIV